MNEFEVIIVGGGPAGLSAALALGRARRRVLLCDSGPWRNAAAVHVHNFVTRDGVTPDGFRAAGAAELARYPGVTLTGSVVESIEGEVDAFTARVGGVARTARRVIVCTGMVDVLPATPGFREHWGTSIFQCPYCHGWEVQDLPFGVLIQAAPMLDFARLLRAWTDDVVAFVDPAVVLDEAAAAGAEAAGVRVERRAVRALHGEGGALREVELDDGSRVPRPVLFARPPQRQVALVGSLGLALDEMGFVRVDDHRETSRPGVYAAGDLTTPMQAAITAAAAGTVTAAMLNHALWTGSSPPAVR